MGYITHVHYSPFNTGYITLETMCVHTHYIGLFLCIHNRICIIILNSQFNNYVKFILTLKHFIEFYDAVVIHPLSHDVNFH